MHNNIIKTNIANNTIAIIACFTGEYCLKTFNYCSEDGPNFPDDPAWANLKTDQDWAAFDSLIQDLVAKYDATYPSDETLANQMDYSSLKEGHQLCLTAFDATKQ